MNKNLLNTIPFDVKSIRKDFPILNTKVYGQPLVYLDNASTTQKPIQVLDAMDRFYKEYNANVHRGVYKISEQATAEFENVRKKIVCFFNCRCLGEVIFARSATEALNLVAYSWGRKFLKEGDEILLTDMEHHSNIIPWQLAAKVTGAKIKSILFKSDTLLDMDAFEKSLTERTKVVSVIMTSNVLGTKNDIETIVKKAHSVNAIVVVDATQTVPHEPVDFQKLNCDFLVFSGHKMCGPTGVGVLLGKVELLSVMEPFLGGGEMIKEVWLDKATWNELPYKFEAGTPPIAQVIGLGAAIDYLKSVNLEKINAYEKILTDYAFDEISKIDGLKIYSCPYSDTRGSIITFTIEDIHPHDLSTIVDRYGVAIRAGHHCAQPLHRKLGIPATNRASFYLYNTLEEVDILVDALKSAIKFFRK